MNAPLSLPSAETLSKLGPDQLRYMIWRAKWLATSREKQRAPIGAWSEWGLLAGRGFGKTLCGAQWLADDAYNDPEGHGRVVIAPTFSDVRFVCFEGPTGLLSILPPELVTKYNADDMFVEMRNVAGGVCRIRGFSAERPERLRGPQFASLWADELAAWQYREETWDMAMMGLRLGKSPKICWTTTPKPVDLVRKLIENKPGRIIVRGSTYENQANLPEAFFKQLQQYEGTTLGRQELMAEMIDPEQSGIVKRSQFRLWPADKVLPPFDWIVMSLDTAFTEATRDKKGGDPDFSACTVWGGFSIEEPKTKVVSIDDIPELEDDKPHARRTGSNFRAEEARAYVMLLDCWQEQLGLPDLITKVKRELNTAYGDDHDKALIKPLIGGSKPRTSGRKVDLVIIEDKGSGISLRQTLDREGIATYAYNPGRADKLTRLHLVSPIFARRLIWIPESNKFKGKPRTWIEPLLHQLCSFTGSGSIKHDDLVDSSTQALRYFVDKGMLSAIQPIVQSIRTATVVRDNPYAQ